MCLSSFSWDFFSVLSPVSFALHTVLSHRSLFASGCHFQSLLSSHPFPLLTHSELSIATSLPHFPSLPLSIPLFPVCICARSLSPVPVSFPFSQFALLLYGSLSLSASSLSRLPPHPALYSLALPLSPCFSMSLT